MTSQNLFAQSKSITLYSNGDVLSSDSSISTKRRDFNHDDRGVLNSDDGEELGEPSPVHLESKVVSFEDGKILYLAGLSPFVNSSMELFRRADAGAESVDEAQSVHPPQNIKGLFLGNYMLFCLFLTPQKL
jgi:hypothetical protein